MDGRGDRRRIRRGTLLAFLSLSFFAALLGGTPAAAVPPDPVDEGNGREWRQLYETTGLTWNQIAQVCPRDGVTPCAGSVGPKVLTGWLWATATQVVELLDNYEPAIATASPPIVAGPAYFLSASFFLGDMRWTRYFALTYQSSQSTDGWTSSTDAGTPLAASVGAGFPPPAGGFAVEPGGAAGDASQTRGVWLWRPTGGDHTPPSIASTLTGTAGANGWYVSDVTVSWAVDDPESQISSKVGCDPANVTADTAGTTFQCRATSTGGTATASALVQRDTTRPSVTCGTPAPVFELYQLGAWVPASVTDATSGPAAAQVQGVANRSAPGFFTTPVTGSDRAGNTATTSCPYQVVVPTCNGLMPTRLGTAQNDVINGTAGRDVIVALGGADTVYGKGGNDVICGGDGPDTIDGGEGSDWIDGGASPDDLSGGSGNDFLDGGAGNDSLRGGNGKDTCLSGEVRLSSCEL
ncbi:MAG TPA: calcium-binding protein [Gaiellaceae bacterium]|nr:calcium-binding protein [Gaiellaceae bacterium]